MISLLESAKLADGRNILNFSVDTVDELALLPSGGAKWESMGHDYGVPAVGSTATLEDTGETYYLNKYLQWELVGKGEVLSSVYYVTVEEAQDGNYYSNYTLNILMLMKVQRKAILNILFSTMKITTRLLK